MENGLASWFFPLSWGPTRRRRGSRLIKDGDRSDGHENEPLSDRKRIPPLPSKERRGKKKHSVAHLPATRSSRSNGGINVRWKFPAALYWPVDITRFVKMVPPRANSQFGFGSGKERFASLKWSERRTTRSSPTESLPIFSGTSPGRLFLGSTARLNLPQFTADFPWFRMLPGNLTSSDRIFHPRAAKGDDRRRVTLALILPKGKCHVPLRNVYVRKPLALISGPRLSPVLFNACLKLIKAAPPLPSAGTSLVPVYSQSES